jgi:hypothetical protein
MWYQEYLNNKLFFEINPSNHLQRLWRLSGFKKNGKDLKNLSRWIDLSPI